MYHTDRPNIGESRLFVVRDWLSEPAALDDLNASLGRDALTSAMLTAPFVPVNAANILIGDPGLTWDAALGAVRFCVVAGTGYEGGVDFEHTLARIDVSATAGRAYTVYTSVYGYLHPDAFRSKDAVGETLSREVARQRLMDWLRARVFNYTNPAEGVDRRVMPLTSREFSTTSDDRLKMGQVQSGKMAYFSRDYAEGMTLYGVHIVYRAQIQ